MSSKIFHGFLLANTLLEGQEHTHSKMLLVDITLQLKRAFEKKEFIENVMIEFIKKIEIRKMVI